MPIMQMVRFWSWLLCRRASLYAFVDSEQDNALSRLTKAEHRVIVPLGTPLARARAVTVRTVDARAPAPAMVRARYGVSLLYTVSRTSLHRPDGCQ